MDSGWGASPEPSRAGGPTILVIEDDTLIAQVITWTLEDEGYRVIFCDRGRKGLAVAEEEKPAAIVLDLKLPDFDGHQVLQALKQHPNTQAIPVIIASATADRLTATERALASAIVHKPYDLEVLLRSVRQVCARQPSNPPNVDLSSPGDGSAEPGPMIGR